MRFVVMIAAVTFCNVIAVHADTETAIQATLEGIPSGVAVNGVADDGVTPITVRPLRTWKSKTGHYCRTYRLNIRGPIAREITSVRCRETGGGWFAPK